MTTWRDDLGRVVSPGWGNSWVTSPSNTRWYDDGTDGIHRKLIPGVGTGSYGVMERALPLNVVGVEQEVLVGFRIHYGTGVGGEDDRLDFFLGVGDHTTFGQTNLRLRMEFGTLNVKVKDPLNDVNEDIVFDPDLCPADVNVLMRCAIGADTVQAKIWLASGSEPGWQVTQPLGVSWVGGTYVWFDPFGAPGDGIDDTDDEYGKLFINFVQVSVPETLVTDSRIFYREAWA